MPPFDVLAGMAGVAMAGVWWGGAEGRTVARLAADGLMGAAEHVSTGLDWPFFPGLEMRLPNFSHGTAGIVAALAVAGAALDDPALWTRHAVGPSTSSRSATSTATDSPFRTMSPTRATTKTR